MKSDYKQPVGSLRISRDVIATIAGTAAREVEGVSGLAAVGFTGILSHRKAVHPVTIALSDDIAIIDLRLVLKNGVRIPIVADCVQRAVKESVQNMTGIAVSKVNVVIDNIAFDASVQ
ncbi:MAG: Asp23/Gls24 family envelope stress response protein [Oscillospiraceae bacterium]